jgi:hypothetical protein
LSLLWGDGAGGCALEEGELGHGMMNDFSSLGSWDHGYHGRGRFCMAAPSFLVHTQGHGAWLTHHGKGNMGITVIKKSRGREQ